MRLKWIIRTALSLSLIYIFQAITAMALVPKTSDSQTTASASTPSSLNLTSQNLGLYGPFNLGLQYDSLEKFYLKAQYSKSLTDAFAVGLLGEVGENQYRLNGTLGFELYTNGLLKLGGEYLSQTLPFNFDSGNINQRVSQPAFGLRFEHQLDDAIFKIINVGTYWADAPNHALATQNFITASSLLFSNQRNIAGATSQGFDLGTALLITPNTSLEAALNYDTLKYHTKLVSSTPYNKTRLGETLKLNQLIGDRLQFSAQASQRALYNTYGLELAYAPDFGPNFGIKIAAFGQHLVSSNSTPSSDTYGIKLSFLDKATAKKPFSLDSDHKTTDLAQAVQSPAVYMDRVMVIAEQITTLVGPIFAEDNKSLGPPQPQVISINPYFGPIAGGTPVMISGSGFTGATKVAFGAVNVTSFTVVNDTQINTTSPVPVPTALTVDVTVTTPGGTNSTNRPLGVFDYLNTPGIITNISIGTTPTNPLTFTGANLNYAGANVGNYAAFFSNGPPVLNTTIGSFTLQGLPIFLSTTSLISNAVAPVGGVKPNTYGFICAGLAVSYNADQCTNAVPVVNYQPPAGFSLQNASNNPAALYIAGGAAVGAGAWYGIASTDSKANIYTTKLQERQAKILDLLKKFNMLSENEIYTKLSTDEIRSVVRHDIYSLQRQGLIQSQPQGGQTLWSLVE